MAVSEGLVPDLAGAVLDGTPIDWAAAESSADESNRPLLAELRVLAALADLHRRPPLDAASDAPVATDDRGEVLQHWGHLRVLERIGYGAFGEVYRAWDTRLDREVALKLLPADRGAGDGPASSIIQEGRLLARVRHPNVATIYGAEQIGTRIGLWMEFIRGRTLKQIVDGGKVFSGAEASEIGAKLCQAVAAVHSAGLLHRDIKAQNVMLAENGRAVLMDFGTGRELADNYTSDLAGTPLSLAPEILQGREATVQSDIYSVGVLLYHLVTGSYPVRAQSLGDVRLAHERGERTGIRKARAQSDLSPKLARILERAIDPRPELRYRSADALAADLAALKPRPTRPLRYATVAAALLVLAGAVGWEVLGRQVGSSRTPSALLSRMWLGHMAGPATPASIASLIVLPFDNLSRNASEDYFSSGMTDVLITDLSRLPNLKVISRTSSARYKTLGKSSQAIGRELGVEAIVDGTVLRADDQVRISVRLVDAATDRVLWAQDYRRKLQDVLSLQADVARAIANEIRTSFVPADQQRLASAPTIDREALNEYLKGRHQWNRRTPSSLLQALAHFREAVQRQPAYAAAHAAIAETLVVLPAFPIAAMSPEEALPQARAAAERAIALDNRLAEAHVALAYVRLHSLDPAGAETAFRQALTINPNYATAHFWYAAALGAAGRFDESIAEAKRAETLDPVSPIIVSGTAWMHHLARRFDDEVQSARAALALEPNFLMAHYRLGEGLLHLGRAKQAVAALENARAQSGNSTDLIAAVAYAHGRMDRHREARESLRTLLQIREAKTRYVSAYTLALVYTGLADRDEAFAWLRRARAERAWGMAFINVEPDFDPLRSDPRFAAVAGK